MEQKIIAVIGATGSQGKGVVKHLVASGLYKVRALTRKPQEYKGEAHEAVAADLENTEALTKALEGAYGVFVVTNFWAGADELKQGGNAVTAAKAAGVSHYIWSTLPDVEAISKNVFDVPHFTLKAKVDELVQKAGFKYSTFVQAPFYYQNFAGMLAASTKPDGSTGWTLPINPAAKVIHMGDISELGMVVTGAFGQPEKAGKGTVLSFAAELKSFNEVIADYQSIGKTFSYTQVPAEVFGGFFPGAQELANMFAYFEAHEYMGPNSKTKVDLANEIAGKPFTSFKAWAKANA